MSSIPASTLVNVQPGVVSGVGAPLALNGLMLTQSPTIPVNGVQSFPSLSSVQDFFGATSTEAELATNYFLGYDGSPLKPSALLVSQFAPSAVAAWLRGTSQPALTLAQVQAVIPAVTTAAAGGTCTGSISGSTFTVASAVTGTFRAGDILSGPGGSSDPVTSGTTIIAQLTGTPGAAGTYSVNISQTSTSATITGTSTTLVVSAVASGAPVAGMLLTGTGVASGNRIVAQLTGSAGGIGTYSLAATDYLASTAVTGAYDLALTVDGSPASFATVNLSTAASFSDAATLLTTALSKTVTYNSQLQAFQITSGTTGASSTITYASASATASFFGWTLATGATISQGSIASVPATLMTALALATQNWISFFGTWEPNLATKELFSAWANSTNSRFAYIGWDTDANAISGSSAASWGAVVNALDYVGSMPIYNDANVAAFLSGAIASLDYSRRNGRPTFAFKGQSGLTPTVTDETIAANLTANGYNFYGSYATANQQFQNLQPGQTSGEWNWIDSFVNQVYLNASLQAAFLNLLTNVPSIPYNQAGYNLMRVAAQDPINAALNFGSIRAGVPLSSAQAAAVNMAAGVTISDTLTNVGYYLQILPATADARVARTSPPCTLWYMDGGAVQRINLSSINVM